MDLGDGVLCVEFHSKMNAIGGDTLRDAAGRRRTKPSANFAALVVGNDAPNFSAGANLMLLLLEAQEGNWDEIDLMVRSFQRATMALRYAQVPVVVAPAGLALGGGCEIALHADRVQAAAETYMGLVEVGVGLIPAGGGHQGDAGACRSTDCRRQRRPAAVRAARVRDDRVREDVDERRPTRCGSATCATVDGITMNRERLMADAKARALQRVRDGYQPPPPRTAIPRRRRARSRRRSSLACTSRGAPGASAITTR